MRNIARLLFSIQLQTKTASIFGLYGDDLNLTGVDMGALEHLKWILVVRVTLVKYLY